MSRNLSTPNGGVLSPIAKVLSTYGTITAGDLVVANEFGGVHAYTKDAPYAAVETNNTAGGKKLWGQASNIIGQSNGYYQYDQIRASFAKLSNGNIVQITRGDGPSTNQTYAVNYGVLDTSGNIVVAMTQVSGTAGTPVPSVGVYAFPTGGFAVVFAISTTLYMSTYDNNGTAIVNAATLATDYSAATYYWHAIILSGGNLALIYNKSASLAFRRYNASGVEQGSVLTLDAGTAPWYVFGAWEAANGDVVTVYQSGSYTKSSRCTSTGTLVGSSLTLGTSNSLWQSAQCKYLAVMNADNTVVVLSADTSSSGYAGLYFISATNTLTTSKTYSNGQLTAVGFSSGNLSICGADNVVYLFGVGSSYTFYGEYTSTGQTVKAFASTLVTGPTNYNMSLAYNCGFMKSEVLAPGCIIACMSAWDGGSVTYNYVLTYNKNASTGSTTTLTDYTGGASVSGIRDAALVKDGTFMMAINVANGQQPNNTGFYLLRSGVFGIATTSFAKGSTGYVATTGIFDLPSSQRNGPLSVFDATAYGYVAGNKGAVYSQSVNLKGL